LERLDFDERLLYLPRSLGKLLLVAFVCSYGSFTVTFDVFVAIEHRIILLSDLIEGLTALVLIDTLLVEFFI